MDFSSLHNRIGKATRAAAALVATNFVPFTVETTGSYERQWGYVEDKARAVALLCSRRSGKSEGSVVKTCKRNTEQAGRKVLYIHHTRKLAKDQFYRKVVRRLRAHSVAIETNDSELQVDWKNGSLLLCIGCDDQGAVGKARGYDWDEIIIDEMQEFADEVLRELLDEAILPTMFDRGGAITAQGTPPAVHAGVWWDIINNAAWSHRRWTLLENPYIQQQNIVDTMALRGFQINFEDPTANDPIVQREVFGLLAIDPSKLVYIYEQGRNSLPPGGIPGPDSPQWRHSLGLDLGLSDNDAIVVWGWRADDPAHTLYMRHCWKQNHLDVDVLAGILRGVVLQYRPVALVGDTGGHGATKVLETLANRLGVTFLPKPASVHDSVALMNDDYRTGRIKMPDDCELAIESKKVAWDEKRKKFSTAFHSDLTEAARYAHHAAVLGGFFTGRSAAPEPTLSEQRLIAAQEKQRKQLDPMGLRRGYEGRQWKTG